MTLTKRILSLILALVITLSLGNIYALADEEQPEAEQVSEITVISDTNVSGIKEKLSKSYSSDAALTLKITPAKPERTVKLQYYNPSEKKYVTVKTYTTESSDTASLKVTFPKSCRKKAVTKWKIAVDKSENANSFTSKPITLINKNIETLSINGRAACIYCVETGEVIYSKNMNKKYKQASTTKIMTAMLLIESGKLGRKTKVTKSIAKTPYGCLSMKAGDVYRNKDLLYALMLPSSNEAANAIAKSVSKDSKSFVKKMNKKAKKLGMENTLYTNAHGLDTKNNHSTAYDIAKLTAYASKNKTFMKVIKKKSYSFKTVKKKEKKSFVSRDKLKGYSKNHLGGKTGYTDKALNCFSSVYKYKGKHYAVVMLGSRTEKARWSDVKKLYKYIDKYTK